MNDQYAYRPVTGPAAGAPTIPDIPPEILYKRSLRHDLMMIVLMLLAFYCAMQFLAAFLIMIPVFLSPEFGRLISDSLYAGASPIDLSAQITALLQNDSLTSLASTATILAEAVALPIFIAVRGKRMFTTDVFLTREKMRPAVFVQIFVIAFGAQFVFSVLAELLNALLGKVGASATDMYSSAMESMMNVPGYIYIMLLGPIMEELVFRSAIMKKLERYGASFAIVMSAMFFACYHIFFVQVVFAFPVGILLGYVAYRYSVKWSMLMHILYNSAAMLFSAVIPNAGVEWIVFAAIFVIAVVLLVLNRNEIRFLIRAGKSVQRNTWSTAFSGASIILFLVGVAGLSMMMSGLLSL
jgi:membrane protease YdiL (CAAX protease family)